MCPPRKKLDILARAEALRKKTSSVYGKSLQGAETAKRLHQRAAQLLSVASTIQKKTTQSRTPNAAIVQFLKIDSDIALTFAQTAMHSHNDHHKRARNLANARKAHDAVVHWKNKLEISQRDALEIDEKLKKLRAVLEKLGERL